MSFDYSLVEPYVTKLLWMLGIMLVDLFAGVLQSLFIDKNFQWEELPRFLQKDVLYIFGWGAFIFFSAMPAEYSEQIGNALGVAETTVYAGIMAGVGASILATVAKFGVAPGGLNKIGIGDGTSRKDK